MNHVLTTHLRERFVQRSNPKKYIHLKHCSQVGCEQCSKLKSDCRKEIDKDLQKIDAQLHWRIDESIHDKSYTNNSQFMSKFYEKYGFDKHFEFLLHEDLLFVAVIEAGRRIIVTCLPSKTHIAGRTRQKFKKNSTEH